jgi:ABC-2 type transport system permease protein
MNAVLFGKTVNDAKVLFAALLLLMFGFPIVFLWASGMISMPAFTDFVVNAMPKEWQGLWGVPIKQVATPAGRAALLYVHPLVMTSGVVWAIARGSDCVSGEIGRGTMEMLLAQPVRRVSWYATHAAATVLGALVLAVAVWCGTAIGLQLSSLYEGVEATLFIPPAINLFGLMVCVAGLSALVSSWGAQRGRTIGIVVAVYVLSAILGLVGNVSERWNWVNYFTFVSAYKPQTMVAWPEDAWALLAYQDGALAGIGLGGCQIVLFLLGVVFYGSGAVIFCRREIPAPL